jgi:hypothetical protein
MLTVAISEMNKETYQCHAAGLGGYDGFPAWRTDRQNRNTRICEGKEEMGALAGQG